MLEPGEVRAGDEIVVESRPGAAPSVAEVFRELAGRRDRADLGVFRGKERASR